ncbi:hypothetical protein [Aliterella atlantica]|nr:hypothetical protein [Aliterella atlantica]
MLTTSEPKSNPLHRLARFVSTEAAAVMFDIQQAEIYRVERWANIVYVHAKGISRFVSYADFPPSLAVASPTDKDFSYWRRRWKKRQQEQQKRQAPPFWIEFFARKLDSAISIVDLRTWGELIGTIKFSFREDSLQLLRASYSDRQFLLL